MRQVEKFKYLGVVFTSDRRGNKETDTRIDKANAVLRELYRSVVTKQEISIHKNDRSLLRSSLVAMNLG